MSGARRERLAALVASVLLSTLAVVLASPTAAGPPDCTIDPLPVGCETTTSSTSIPETTTTFVETTTTFEQPTTTRGTATTEERVVTTTSTTLDVSTSVNVLVPGDGTEGAESTTTTQTPTTISNAGTSDAALIALIVGGLLLLAVAVSILTWRYWVATRPPLVATVGSDHG